MAGRGKGVSDGSWAVSGLARAFLVWDGVT